MARRDSNAKINAPTVLLVEGDDENDILSLMLSNMKSEWGKDVDIRVADGRANLVTRLHALAVISGFADVKKIAVCVDADDDPQATNQEWLEIQQSFKVTHKTTHPDIEFDFLVLPDPAQSGALENVFLNSIKHDDPSLGCVKSLMACVFDHAAHSTQAQKDKFALITYVNTHVTKPYHRIGTAVRNDAYDLFDFEHRAFESLRAFLRNLLNV